MEANDELKEINIKNRTCYLWVPTFARRKFQL